MSTRISASTRQIVNHHFNDLIRPLENEVREEKKRLENQPLDEIKKSKEFKQLVKSLEEFKTYVYDKYPDITLYSKFRESIGEDSSIGYFDSNTRNQMTNTYIQEREAKITAITKEKNMLMFKLENAPIKSDEYKEAYDRLQTILLED